MKKQKELDRLTKELVKQMTGNEVEDTQEGDYQIAYYYLSKAMDYWKEVKQEIMKPKEKAKELFDRFLKEFPSTDDINTIRLALDTPEYNRHYVKHTTDAKMILNKQEKAINYTHCCESESEQLHTEVFKLANKLAINGYGNEAVKMHHICNGM